MTDAALSEPCGRLLHRSEARLAAGLVVKGSVDAGRWGHLRHQWARILINSPADVRMARFALCPIAANAVSDLTSLLAAGLWRSIW